MHEVSGAATFRRPADAYDRHIGRYCGELARALIAAAGVRPGARALDVGCGPGALTAELVALLGSDHVAAIEPSPQFAEACRSRHPEVEVHVGSAEALPFDDAAFHHAFAQLVVNFMTDPTAMPYCTVAELRGLWSSVGLADVEVAPVVASAGYDDFEDLWQPLERGVAPSGAYAASLAPDARAALEDELRRRLNVGARSFRLNARAWIAVGRVGSNPSTRHV